ncbi:MAG TPA: amidohydrolase [Candidatus Pullichristensenella excrementigallinarum]|uniref:Amidohydrolase n=1 Tax=Candidatus Pullichristensenella excrementigallinarum TaxID=2840907 RepID=A0A9D1IDI2_9FIRM|nr:amidohydrolase [Candidatus Pullichristensenella excrementigallinarum]
MAIDAHQHPLFFRDFCADAQIASLRREQQAYYKMGVQDVRRVIEQNRINGVEKSILLPHDFSHFQNDRISNDAMRQLVDRSEGAFYGFAAVDPNRDDAPAELERAFGELGLSGLKLHLAKQKIAPSHMRVLALMEICQRYNKPVVFHAGISWQPDATAQYARPVFYEPIAVEFPKLRFSLAHMGFPWVTETAALLAKYPNMYADLAALYFDSTDEFFHYLFDRAMDYTWLDRGIRHQVLFGTNSPRWGAKRALAAIRRLPLREETVECITGRNALEFLGEEEVNWLD